MTTSFYSKNYKGQELSSYWQLDKIEHLNCGHEYPEHRSNIRFYDDGFGELYVYQTTYGFDVIRAMSWEDAFDIARDEFCTKVEWDDLDEDEKKEIESDHGCEGYEWSPNNGLVHVDYNESLDLLSDRKNIDLEIFISEVE